MIGKALIFPFNLNKTEHIEKIVKDNAIQYKTISCPLNKAKDVIP